MGAGSAVSVVDPAVHHPISAGVLFLAAGIPIAPVVDPDVERAVEVGVLFGALGRAAGVVDDLVVRAVFVVIDPLLVDVFVLVVEEFDRSARCASTREWRGDDREQRKERYERPRDSGHAAADPV